MGYKGIDERYRSVDFIKGICILFIIITHHSWSKAEMSKYLFPFWIDMAVPLFMIISGFVYSESYKKHNITSFEEAYAISNVLNKVMRYTIPFTIVFGVEIVTLIIRYKVNSSASQMICYFLTGGFGPGSYYYPVMMQFIFFFPVIFFIIRRYRFNGLIICGSMNFVYELLHKAYGMNEECYRLLLFRYILVIAFGCYLSIKKNKYSKKVCVISMLAGITYIVLYRYLGYTPLLTIHWTGTSFWACLYIMPISIMILRNEKLKCKVVELLGKASYNIFLVQMVYYNDWGGVFSYDVFENRAIQLLINMIICLPLGILFYYIETLITKSAIHEVQIIISKITPKITK